MASSQWTETDNALTRQFQFADFVTAFAFVTQVALLAQRQDHHPDITISWNKVTVTSMSHDTGSTVTDRDHRLADSIDKLV
ncbi:MAG: 4a-hydroxytetrahydrobiopterin dehydratase [Ilumatobacteraceae bacterium]|nr:4a-hydroxytetrahydrobiopterin dehydratase [Ilumatobacteraceae bacterium]